MTPRPAPATVRTVASVSTPVADSHARFCSTQWGLVLATGQAEENPALARGALAELCAAYWPPLYAFARRKGRSPADAKDAVQGFLLGLIEARTLGRADPARGRFRAFLQTAFHRHLINDWERATALKRGGGRAPLELDADAMETRGLPELVTAATPERAFEERWARTVWERSLAAMAAQAQARGKSAAFQALRPFLAQEGTADSYAAAGAGLGLSGGGVKTLVHRLRRELGETLRREVERTVADPADAAAEVQHLRAILGEILP